MPASVFSYTAKTAQKEEITGAMGLMISASVIGIIVGRSAVGLITDLVDWRSSFLIYAIVLLSFSLFFQLILEEPKSDNNQKVLSLYVNALKMFFNPTILMRFVIGFSLFFGYLGLSSFMTYALKAEPFNLTSTQLSWLNLVGISAVIGSKIASNISKHIENGKLITILLSCVFISISILGFSTNIVVVAIGIFFLFITVFAVQPIIMADLNSIVSSGQKGTISSLYFLSCLSGGSAATYILGNVWANYQWQGVVYVCLAVLAFAVLLSLMLVKKPQ
ncbi:MFS transporter [Vibrio mediterranei]